MKLAQIQIYACDRLVISAGPGRENSSHRHFGAIVTLAPDAPVTLMSRDAEPIVCRAAIVAPNAWHRIDARNARTVTVLIGPDHPWFRYIKPLLSGEPIVTLDFAALDGCAIPWDALFEGTCDCREAQRAAQAILQAFGGIDAPPHQLDARIEEVLQILRDAVDRRADAGRARPSRRAVGLHADAAFQGRARRAHSRVRAVAAADGRAGDWSMDAARSPRSRSAPASTTRRI